MSWRDELGAGAESGQRVNTSDLTAFVPIIAAGTAGLANFVATFMLLRFFGRMRVLSVVRWGFLLGLAAFVAAVLWFSDVYFSQEHARPDLIARLACAGLFYLAGSYVFFGYVFLPEASVRLRVLQELVDGGGASLFELLEKYGAAEIIRLRLSRLVDSGQIVHRGDLFFTGRPRLLHVAKMFCLLKRLFLSGVIDSRTHLPGN